MDMLKGIISARSKKSITREDPIVSPIDLQGAPAVSRYVQAIADSQAIEENPQKLRDIIESIESTYLQEPAAFQSNASSFELDKFTSIPSLSAIDERRAELLCQHRAVSKKLGESILQNEASYRTELKRVIELTIDVEQASRTAQSARGALHNAQTSFTTRSLKLLANFARRRRALHILHNLRVLRTLKDTEIHLKEMLIEGEDFLAAINISLEFTSALRQFDTLRAAHDLHGRLQDSLLMIDDALDRAVKRCCAEFVAGDYRKIKRGFVLIGKQHLFVEQIQSAFSSLLHTHATQVLHARFGGSVSVNAGADGEQGLARGSVSVPLGTSPHDALATLLDFCAYFFKLFVNYRAMLFVELHDAEADAATKQRLAGGRQRLWTECEARVRNLLAQIDFQSFKIDEFVRLLRIVQLLCSVGEQFLAAVGPADAPVDAAGQLAAAPNQSLADVLQRVTSVYFRAFHRASLEQLRLFLEHEVWELCPVTRADTLALERIWQQNVANSLNSDTSITEESAQLNSDDTQTVIAQKPNRFDTEFEQVLTESQDASDSSSSLDNAMGHAMNRLQSPFDVTLLRNEPDGTSDADESHDAESQEEEADGRRRAEDADDDSRHRTGSSSSQSLPSSGSGIIASATSLEVLRLLSKYLDVARLLHPIAFEVSLALTQLFEYYLFTVHSFFATKISSMNDFMMDDEDNNAPRAKLLSTLQRINNWITDLAGVPPTQAAVDQRPFGVPNFELEFELRRSDNLCGFTKRVVATESLVFLAGQFERIVPHLSSLIPSARRPSLTHFQSHTLGVVSELRPFVFLDVARGALAYDRVLSLCRANSGRWDVRDIPTQHSDYIDVLLGEFKLLRIRLRDAKQALAEANAARVPQVVKCFVFARALRYSAAVLVDCFSVQNARCTNEGRALMQLDFQQFVVKVEEMMPKRLLARAAAPLPYANTLKLCREYVETYVKAYYYNEDQIENWLREQHTYRADQLASLVRCMPHLSKRIKQRFQLIIDEQAASASVSASAGLHVSESNNNLQLPTDSMRPVVSSELLSTPGNPSSITPQSAGDRPRTSLLASNHSASPLTINANSTKKFTNIFHKSNS